MARKQLTPTRKEKRDYDKFAREATFEAEFLALLIEHPHTPSELVGSVRFILIAALDKLREQLNDYNGDGQMVRDIFPHALLVEPGFAGAFHLILKEAEKKAPRVINSIQAHSDKGEVPPRYPHPLKEYFRKHRNVFRMDGLTEAEKKRDGA